MDNVRSPKQLDRTPIVQIKNFILIGIPFALLFLAGCNPGFNGDEIATMIAQTVIADLTQTESAAQTQTALPTSTPSLTSTITPTPTPTWPSALGTPLGCEYVAGGYYEGNTYCYPYDACSDPNFAWAFPNPVPCVQHDYCCREMADSLWQLIFPAMCRCGCPSNVPVIYVGIIPPAEVMNLEYCFYKSSPTPTPGLPALYEWGDWPELNTPTPTPGPARYGTVLTLALCWTGPGSQYEVVSSIRPDTEVEVLGTGQGGRFIIVRNPKYFRECWLKEEAIDTGDLDLSSAPIFKAQPVPPKKPAAPETGPEIGCLVPQAVGAPLCVVPCPDPVQYPNPCTP